MTTLLSQAHRRAAHGKHVCGYCFRKIASGEMYLDQRCADSGTAWTWRAHLACHSAYWSWDINEEDSYPLADITEGHLPPCPLAWMTPAGQPDPPCLCVSVELTT